MFSLASLEGKGRAGPSGNVLHELHDLSLGKQVLSGRGSSGHTVQAIVLSRAYGAAFQYTAFDCPSTPANSPVSVGGAGKRTQFLHRLRTALFLVPSSEPNLRKPRNLSQRRRCVAHDRALGSEPNVRLEEPWRSAPRKIRKACPSTKWMILFLVAARLSPSASELL